MLGDHLSIVRQESFRRSGGDGRHSVVQMVFIVQHYWKHMSKRTQISEQFRFDHDLRRNQVDHGGLPHEQVGSARDGPQHARA